MSTCPFCGLAAVSAHDTQEGCIEALHAEIIRMRAVLAQTHSVAVPPPANDVDPEGPEPDSQD